MRKIDLSSLRRKNHKEATRVKRKLGIRKRVEGDAVGSAGPRGDFARGGDEG